MDKLIFSKKTVQGTIVYSSNELIDPGWEMNLKEQLQKKFPHTNFKLNFIKVAGESDLASIRQSTQNIIKDPKTEMSIYIKSSTEIIKKIFEIIIIQFPVDNGVILKIDTIYNLNGIQEIIVYVSGNKLSKDGENIIKKMFEQGISQIIGLPIEFTIVYKHPNPLELYCTKVNVSISEILENLNNFTVKYLIENPYLLIDVYLDEQLYEIFKISSINKQFSNRLNYKLLDKNNFRKNCKAIISYRKRDT